MANKYNLGDTAFLVESNRIIREVKILKVGGGFYTILFTTKEEAEASFKKR